MNFEKEGGQGGERRGGGAGGGVGGEGGREERGAGNREGSGVEDGTKMGGAGLTAGEAARLAGGTTGSESNAFPGDASGGSASETSGSESSVLSGEVTSSVQSSAVLPNAASEAAPSSTGVPTQHFSRRSVMDRSQSDTTEHVTVPATASRRFSESRDRAWNEIPGRGRREPSAMGPSLRTATSTERSDSVPSRASSSVHSVSSGTSRGAVRRSSMADVVEAASEMKEERSDRYAEALRRAQAVPAGNLHLPFGALLEILAMWRFGSAALLPHERLEREIRKRRMWARERRERVRASIMAWVIRWKLRKANALAVIQRVLRDWIRRWRVLHTAERRLLLTPVVSSVSANLRET